jgi:hypothetical protein
MTSLSSALDQLREERKRAQEEVEQLDKAIAAIQAVVGGQASTAHVSGKRYISAAGRRRIAAAQRARWAKSKALNKAPGGAGGSRRRRTMSASARRKIAAAQRARWAKVRQQRKGAA